MRRLLLVTALLAACASEPAPSAPLAAWDPIDESFAGCQGACGHGAHGAVAGAVEQPGAHVGATTYCPVSGAVFEVEATHPTADVGGQTLYFCCAGCAEHFASHRDEVIAARRIGQRASR